MSPGGADIGDVLRRLGDEAILDEAEARGLSPKAGRLKCPFAGCEHKGASRERDAVIFAGGHPRVHCYACGTTGDYIDVLQRTRGWTRAEALAHIQGLQVPDRPAPALRVVGARPPDEAGKLTPAEAQRVWDALAKTDDMGTRYLESRGLERAVDAGLVRFAVDTSSDKQVASHARRGHRVAALLTDVVGNARGIQLRLARDARAKESKVLSVKGSVTSRAFFGSPGLIEAAPVIAVAEGMADTLALSLWAEAHAVVVGAAGKGFLPRLAKELEAAGIDVHGKLFCLFPQNDRPQNASRREFVRLSQLLQARGARVVFVTTPDEFKDIADWRQARPDVEWPPPEVARAMAADADVPGAPQVVEAPGLAVPVPAHIRTDRYAQDFTTLCALLDDGASREAIMGRGELTWDEMTQRVRLAGKALAESDLSAVRLGLEGQARSTDGKPLKFSEEDISKALQLLARRAPVHPVRTWLSGLVWDGRHRLDVELPAALGHEANSFEGMLLRRWALSAVARAMRPGCKVDTVLVLVGPQGAGKSTFFATLGGDWHTDSRVDVGDRDGLLVMRQAWVVEWAELDGMRRARDQEALKAFLSARVDVFRAPYARAVTEAPRHCVIVGSTNNREFLGDVSGSRRFWPIDVSTVDVTWARDAREQLFAEAVARFRAGETWWLTPAEDAELAERNREHEAHDVWTDPVTDWLDDNRFMSEVTTPQVLVQAVGRKLEELSRSDEMRVAAILRQLGWAGPYRQRQGNVVRRVYRRPEVRA